MTGVVTITPYPVRRRKLFLTMRGHYRGLKLLALAGALAAASAQTFQTGILYWCSMNEFGLNGANPRSVYSPGTSDVNYACHAGGAQTDGSGSYALTNGSTWTTSDLSPSTCYVSAAWECAQGSA